MVIRRKANVYAAFRVADAASAAKKSTFSHEIFFTAIVGAGLICSKVTRRRDSTICDTNSPWLK
jgi:hypothetical protein